MPPFLSFVAGMILASAAPSAPALAPGGGVLVENVRNGTSEDLAEFVFEAALSGRFGAVETVERWTQLHDDAPPEGYNVYRRWSPVQDFGRCAAAASLPRRLSTAEEMVDPPFGAERHLLKGECVIGLRVSAPTARYALSLPVIGEPLVVRDRSTGTVVARGSDNAFRPWPLFGLHRFNASVWDDTGDYRRPDAVTDAELVRALLGPEVMRSAALALLADRVEVERIWTQGVLVREVRSTGRAVGETLASIGVLASPDKQTRLAGLRAAAAVSDAAAALGPAILAGLDAPLAQPSLSSPEQAQRARIARALPGSQGLFEPRGTRAGTEDRDVAEAAAFATARMGPAAARAAWPRLAGTAWTVLTSSTSSHEGFLLAAVQAGEAENLVLRLLSQSGPPLRAMNARRLVALIQAPSPALRTEVERRCTLTSGEGWGGLPNYCDVITARWGSRAALDRLQRRAAGAEETAPGLGRWPQGDAAFALLLDAGPDGPRRLRALAATVPADKAAPVFAALCHLGPDAGAVAVARVAALAGPAPAPEYGDDPGAVLARKAVQCAAPERSMVGRFAPARPAPEPAQP